MYMYMYMYMYSMCVLCEYIVCDVLKNGGAQNCQPLFFTQGHGRLRDSTNPGGWVRGYDNDCPAYHWNAISKQILLILNNNITL